MGRYRAERSFVRDTSHDRQKGKMLRRKPIVLPPLFVAGTSDVLSWMTRWKAFWLSHWYAQAFRGRLTVAEYARRHGVSPQAVWWLVKRGRLGPEVRDTSGHYWIAEDWPYPDLDRIGGFGRRGVPDAGVRALSHSDFRVLDGGRLFTFTTAADLESYCLVRISPRRTLAEALVPKEIFDY